MHSRAYRPEVPVCLENRSLLSGVAGLSSDPVVLPLRKFNLVAEHIRQGFFLFGRYRDVSQLRSEIDDFIVLIPFQRVDGLEVTIDRIVNRMVHDLSAHVPNAFRTAQNDVIAATSAQVEARVRAGDVIVR